jgi:hypothetical protein
MEGEIDEEKRDRRALAKIKDKRGGCCEKEKGKECFTMCALKPLDRMHHLI